MFEEWVSHIEAWHRYSGEQCGGAVLTPPDILLGNVGAGLPRRRGLRPPRADQNTSAALHPSVYTAVRRLRRIPPPKQFGPKT